MTQSDLCLSLEPVIGQTRQSTVSAWINAKSEPAPDTVFAIEQALELSAGFLSRHLGYLPATNVPPVSTVEEAVIAARDLEDDFKRMLLAVHVVLVQKSAEIRKVELRAVEEMKGRRRRPS